MILHKVRITNRDRRRVSLGFKLNLRIGDVPHFGLEDIKKPNLPPGIVGLAPIPWLETPLDLEPQSSVLGNIAFGMHQRDVENGRAEDDFAPPDVDLEVTDYLSGTSVRFEPGRGYPPFSPTVPDDTKTSVHHTTI